MRRVLTVIALAVSLAGPALAVLPQEQLRDTRLEARARRIGAELRCLVCQNQTIDDSDAPLAADLRVLLRQRLLAGDSDRAAKDYIVARYGHYVLLRPPLEAQTLLLWLGPLLALGAGAAAVAGLARSGGGARPVDEPPLSAEERARLAARLDEADGAL